MSSISGPLFTQKFSEKVTKCFRGENNTKCLLPFDDITTFVDDVLFWLQSTFCKLLCFAIN
jgi:hypothetical protein